jgi:hypothetical protein
MDVSMKKTNRMFTPEEVIKVISNVFVMGEMVGFLDSVSMHPNIPDSVKKAASEKVSKLREFIRGME